MVDPEPVDPAPLSAWLVTATRRLSADSAARVRAEIREHFTSAREAALAAGDAPDDATATALQALGDAAAVNREYRRTLLTACEARRLRKLERSWPPRPVFLIAVAVIVAAFLIPGFRRGDLQAIAFGVGAVILALAALTLPVYTPARSRVFRWLRWAWLAGLLVTFRHPENMLILAAVWVSIDWERIALRRKLPADRWPKALHL